MWMPSWFCSVFASHSQCRSRTAKPRRTPCACLRLESLEDRCLLSYTINEFALPTPNAGGAYGATAGPDGNVWFVEANANNLAQVTPAGQVTEVPIPAQTTTARTIAFGPDGNIWIGFHGAIREFTPQGQLL